MPSRLWRSSSLLPCSRRLRPVSMRLITCAAARSSEPSTRPIAPVTVTCRWIPAHRLVADSLEADWNAKLRALAEGQEDYHRRRAADRLVVDEPERQRILALATDFP